MCDEHNTIFFLKKKTFLQTENEEKQQNINSKVKKKENILRNDQSDYCRQIAETLNIILFSRFTL